MFEPAYAEWSRSAAASGNVFATPEFMRTWHGWSGRPPLRLIRVRTDARDTIGLLALAEERRGPLRLLRFAGHGPADLLGPIGDPHDRALLAAALRAAIERSTRYDLFVGERLPGDYPWAAALGAVELGREGFPVVHLDPGAGWEGYLSRLGSRLRKEIRHDERALERRGSVSLRVTSSRDTLDADIDEFLRLHALRWSDGSSSLLPMAPFLRAFAPIALERGWLRLAFLELDGRAVATRFDLRYGDVYAAVNGGRDPAYAREGVGLVIRGRTIRRALEEGVTEYRFLRGDEAYKYRFADHDPGLVSVIRARTAAGAAALQVLRGARRSGHLRKLLKRLA
ncbi:MAG TPA: GNAT family N-acetyltransferase [Candidatus Limnocylindrales bacterium]|nr:GNAT family N-acetyltransferase [Candidatus Limnocylindrales bacterium]